MSSIVSAHTRWFMPPIWMSAIVSLAAYRRRRIEHEIPGFLGSRAAAAGEQRRQRDSDHRCPHHHVPALQSGYEAKYRSFTAMD